MPLDLHYPELNLRLIVRSVCDRKARILYKIATSQSAMLNVSSGKSIIFVHPAGDNRKLISL